MGIDKEENAESASTTAPFPVIYEMFASVHFQTVKYADEMRQEAKKENESWTPHPIYESDICGDQVKIKETRERILQTRLETLKKDVATAEQEIEKNKEKYVKRFKDLKEYFERKKQELSLKDEDFLIFFDEKNLCIYIGYSPLEFKALFGNLTKSGGQYSEIFNLRSNFLSFNSSDHTDHLDRFWLKKDFADAQGRERKTISEQALNEFSNLPSKNPLAQLSNSDIRNEAQLISACLQNHDGFIVGDTYHNEPSPKQFLIDNMMTMKEQGVKALYMEHLLQEPHQKMLDEYLANPSDEMPKRLALYLAKLDSDWKLDSSSGFTAVVKAAKKHGIRIIAIDTEASYSQTTNQTFRQGFDENAGKKASMARYKLMNIVALNCIRENQEKNPGKYAVFVGGAHVSTCSDVPGLSQLLACPNICIRNGSNNQIIQNAELETNRKDSINVDFLYDRIPVLRSAATSTYDSPPGYTGLRK